MSGFIFVPIVRVRNVGFLAIVRNVVCTNCRGSDDPIIIACYYSIYYRICYNESQYSMLL